MVIYLLTFLISTLLIKKAEKTKKKVLRKALFFFAVLIPSVLAGCRGLSVGTDVNVYGRSFYLSATYSKSFIEYYEKISLGGLSDIGYLLLNYVLSRFLKDWHWGLFAYSFITNGFMCAAFNRYKKIFGTSIWVGMILYYLTLYNISLNAMRQMMAVSIIFYAVSYLPEKKYRQYILYSLLGITFHSSAILSILILQMFLMLRMSKNINDKKQIIQGMFFMGAVVLAVALLEVAVRQAVAMGILRENYLNYFMGGKYAIGAYISVSSVLPYLIYSVIAYLLYKHMKKKKVESLFFFMATLMCLFITFATLISKYIGRSSYYFIPLVILNFANAGKCFDKKSKKLWACLIIILIGTFWIRDFAIYNYHETFPYVFMKG